MPISTQSSVNIPCEYILSKPIPNQQSNQGVCLEETMENLLSTMLPQCSELLRHLAPLAQKWSQPIMKATDQLLKMVLIILEQPIFDTNLHDELSDSTISLANTMVCFLRNMLNEPDIADRINQSEMVPTLNLLASSNNESLKLNVYNLIAYTAHANDVKEMANLGELLDTVFQSLKTLMNQKSNKTTEIEQLLDTLKVLSAMANAINDSECIILCMSDSYKRSTACQCEASYAYKLKRRMIPLIMRKGFKPDGWLQVLIGSRLYINFGKPPFDEACQNLMKEINALKRVPILPEKVVNDTDNSATKEQPSVTVKPNESEKPSPRETTVSSIIKTRKPTLNFIRKSILEWSELDTQDFLVANRLKLLLPLCEEMDGRALIELYNISINNKLPVFHLIKSELTNMHRASFSLSAYLGFLSAIDEVIINSSQELTSLLPTATETTTNGTLTKLGILIPFDVAPKFEKSYDFSITSSAHPFDILKLVESHGNSLLILDLLRRQFSHLN
ncbi:unnamed protein product [Rotaria sordida]|uniref:TIR domain-containing protein n=2 Tax=Rotaria sordida TaxID=392033 RepID=A0A819Q281_9BILA|nr:unnamed protein product [Rotaria sordida]